MFSINQDVKLSRILVRARHYCYGRAVRLPYAGRGGRTLAFKLNSAAASIVVFIALTAPTTRYWGIILRLRCWCYWGAASA